MRVIIPPRQKLVLTRVFDAPRSLVFNALTKPEMLERWLEPRGSSLVVCEIDFRVGGAFRFVWRRPDRNDVVMRGVYREIVPPERLVHTQSFDVGYPDESLVTTVLVEQGGKTTLTTTVLYPTDQQEEAWLPRSS